MGFSYLILVVIVLVGVAFVTLLEQKILSRAQIRVGPNKAGYWGILQSFADAVKLFIKEGLYPYVSFRLSVYILSPVVRLFLGLILWLVFPLFSGGFEYVLGVIFFMCVRGLGVYPILRRGWRSNCKYSLLGRLRRVAQIVSYEISLLMVLLRIVWCYVSLRFYTIIQHQGVFWGVRIYLPLAIIWLVSSLAETNRSPYDFSEGESELVSGFNTEYGAGGFILIFIREYRRILFIGVLFTILFLSGGLFDRFGVVKSIFIVYWFVWVRARYPRFRYDKLIYLAWKRFLPVTLIVFLYFRL